MIGTRLIRRWVATQVKNLPEVGRVRISPGGQAWKSVIGLEIHAQIKTKHKLFSWASTGKNRRENILMKFDVK